MDGSRTRRTRDPNRQKWYAAYRTARFARHMGFTKDIAMIIHSHTNQQESQLSARDPERYAWLIILWQQSNHRSKR